MGNEATPINVPIGTIVPYALEPSHLPSNWHACNGDTFSKEKYPELANILGAVSDPFMLPNLQGRFIRGSNADVSAGTLTTVSTLARPAPDITVRVEQMATDYNWTNKGGALSMIAWNGDASWQSCSGGDKETRPINIAFNYIIKIAKSTDAKGDDIPIAALIPHGAGLYSKARDFPEYLRCDGSTASTTEVGEEILTLVGNRFTSSPEAGRFFAPDLTGKFIRGFDSTGLIDPDAPMRHPPPGAKTGVGSWQDYGTGFKNPRFNAAHFSTFSRGTADVNGPYNIKDASYSNSLTWSSSALETRPVNAAVYHFIHTKDPAKAETPLVFPVGGIIAIPGASKLPPTRGGGWLECDGSPCSRADYSELFTAIGKTWGGDDDDDSLFNLPKLDDCFLRGPDVDGAKANGDPNWNKRTDVTRKKQVIGSGSYQDAATAMSKIPLSNGISYPTYTNQNAKALGSPEKFYDKTSAANGQQTFTLVADWDTETAPVNLRVQFYIRGY